MSFRIVIALLPVNTFNQKLSPCLFLSVPTETQGCCREAAERLQRGCVRLQATHCLSSEKDFGQILSCSCRESSWARVIREQQNTPWKLKRLLHTHTHAKRGALCVCVCVCLCGQQMGARRITKLILNTSQSTNY